VAGDVEAKIPPKVQAQPLKLDLRQPAAARRTDIADELFEAGEEREPGRCDRTVEHGEYLRGTDALRLR
jgi:hypothetical protein